MKFSNKFCQIFEKNENLFPEFGQKTCIHEWISKKMTLKKILEVIFCENLVFLNFMLWEAPDLILGAYPT